MYLCFGSVSGFALTYIDNWNTAEISHNIKKFPPGHNWYHTKVSLIMMLTQKTSTERDEYSTYCHASKTFTGNIGSSIKWTELHKTLRIKDGSGFVLIRLS
jgi:hypothetical protein